MLQAASEIERECEDGRSKVCITILGSPISNFDYYVFEKYFQLETTLREKGVDVTLYYRKNLVEKVCSRKYFLGKKLRNSYYWCDIPKNKDVYHDKDTLYIFIHLGVESSFYFEMFFKEDDYIDIADVEQHVDDEISNLKELDKIMKDRELNYQIYLCAIPYYDKKKTFKEKILFLSGYFIYELGYVNYINHKLKIISKNSDNIIYIDKIQSSCEICTGKGCFKHYFVVDDYRELSFSISDSIYKNFLLNCLYKKFDRFLTKCQRCYDRIDITVELINLIKEYNDKYRDDVTKHMISYYKMKFKKYYKNTPKYEIMKILTNNY